MWATSRTTMKTKDDIDYFDKDDDDDDDDDDGGDDDDKLVLMSVWQRVKFGRVNKLRTEASLTQLCWRNDGYNWTRCSTESTRFAPS